MKKGRMGLVRIVVFLTAIVSFAVAAPASAEGNLFSISGTVTDVLGNPLDKVRVEVESQIQFTDSQGRYRFEFFSSGTYRVWFTRGDLNWTERVSTLSLLESSRTENISMTYRIVGMVSSTQISTLPATLGITADSWAPDGLCLTAKEGSNQITLSFTGIRPDTTRRYSGSFTVPEGSAPGWHYISITAADCESETLVGSGQAVYRYTPAQEPPVEVPDITPPVVDIRVPAQGRMTSYRSDLGESPDGSTMVVGRVHFLVRATDNKAVTSVYFEMFDHENKLTWNCDPYRFGSDYECDEYINFFSATTYTFRTTVRDAAGNVTVVDREFETNGGPLERKRVLEL